MGEPLPVGTFSFEQDGQKIKGKAALSVTASTAVVANADANGKALAFAAESGKGRTLYFPFALGTLINERRGQSLQSIQTESPTAESEEYESYAGEFAISEWLADLLAKAKLTPSYQVNSEAGVTAKIRVEQPVCDAAGNVALVVANRAQRQPQEILPPCRIEVPLPGGPWKQAWWAAAETDNLVSIPVRTVREGIYQVELPQVNSAGVLYFFAQHSPLLSVDPIKGAEVAIDGLTAKVAPGKSFKVTGQLINVAGKNSGEGNIRCQAEAGWKVSAPIASHPLGAGQSSRFEFVVTPPADEARIKPDWLYPIVLTWNGAGGVSALATVHVEVASNSFRGLKLLSDNSSFPATYPYLIHTGATYGYRVPADIKQIADPVKNGGGSVGTALTNGFSALGGMRHSYHRGLYGTANYARYESPVVDIVFDLKKEREIGQVKVVLGPGKVLPKQIQVQVSQDGEVFTDLAQHTFDRPLLEWKSDIVSLRGRYVRIQVEWPEAGGTLDEVEIWGQ